MIPYGRQNITEDDINAVITALKSDFLTQGPEIAVFEKAFAEYIGCKYAVAVSNGTAALHLCTMALGVDENSRVITSPITFAASANCVRYCNGEVYFADIDPETYLLDITKVRALLEKQPKGYFQGIIPVDFAGNAVNLEEFRKLADEFGCWIIEDACHAPGGYFIDSKGTQQFCGNSRFADLAIFSFHPVKHIACGEGGMVTTNDEALYHKLIKLRTHGITKDPELMHKNDGGWYYEMQELGYNYRITDFQAALGTSQLKRADEGLKRRREIARIYEDAFKSNKNIKAQSGVVDGHAYHLYIIEVEKRKDLYDFLRSKDVFCQVHYIPVHTLPYYESLGWKQGDFKNAEQYYKGCLSLPMYPTLTNEQQMFVINLINSFLGE
ncbi:MAG: UDP-4-amino-4,6-dideoxy-N-acetyl-beta-L-altrosamine transaminase [Bacteroidota bacterium]